MVNELRVIITLLKKYLFTIFVRSSLLMKKIIQLCSFIVFFGITYDSYAQDNNTLKTNVKVMEEIKHLNGLHTDDKAFSVKILFKGEEGVTRSLHLKKDGLLPEHTTPIPAILVCVTGKVTYEDENGFKTVLESGGFQKIEPHVKHWVQGLADSQLLLIK